MIPWLYSPFPIRLDVDCALPWSLKNILPYNKKKIKIKHVLMSNLNRTDIESKKLLKLDMPYKLLFENDCLQSLKTQYQNKHVSVNT